VKDGGHVTLDLKSSLCTDNPTGSDTYPFSGDPTQVVQNTGMERAGGITSLYEQETTFATAGAQSLITKSGDLLQLDSSYNVRINDSVIGNVGGYAVSLRGALKGYSDAAWTASNTIIGIVKIGSAIRVDEINPATGAILNTRSTTFTMPTAAITNVVLVKYIGMNYADSLTFILSNNLISYSLVEANAPTVVIIGGQTWTSGTLASGSWNSIAWSPQLGLFATVGPFSPSYSAAISADGKTWTTQTLENNAWKAVVWAAELGLFVAVGAGGTHYAATSPDGVTWTTRTLSSGIWSGLAWNGTTLCAVSSGTNYCATSTDGISWSVQTLEANTWNAIAWSPSLSLFVAVGAGATHYAASSPTGATGTWTLNTLEANTWNAIAWSASLGIFVAIGEGGTHYAASSTNGTSWSTRTLAANTWKSVAWSPQLSIFVAIAKTGATNFAAYSGDGINWTSGTSTFLGGMSICWAPQLSLFTVVMDRDVMTSYGTQQAKGDNFCWKFSSGKYILGNQGIAGSFYIGDIAGALTQLTNPNTTAVSVQWAVIDIFAGTSYSRAILTGTITTSLVYTYVQGLAEVGYNQAGSYTSTPTWYGPNIGHTITVGTATSGPGYSEATYTRSDTGTAIYYYLAPLMQHKSGSWYEIQQSQTQTLCNGYGRLTDFQGNTLGNTCSLRVLMQPATATTSLPTTLSAGILGQDASYDCLGVLVTNVGEFDETYVPHVVDNGSSRLNCIYRYNGILFFFVIQSGTTNTLQAVSDNVYMVNTLSPINAIDVANKTLNLGANDYNGRILLRSSAALVSVQQLNALIQGTYANSLDVGALGRTNVTQTFSTITNIVPGIELPSFIDRVVPGYGVNVYVGTAPSPTYSTTYQSFNVVYTNTTGNFVGTQWVDDTRIPFAMGYTFYSRTMQTEIETIFSGVGVTGSANINYDYLCYEIGNDTPGQYKSFALFGNQYLFDGNNIWLAYFTGSLFSGKGNNPIAPATGVSLIASTPTEIFFLSALDTSLYSFNGGRSLTKVKRMNDLRNASNVIEPILNGVYNVRDDTLLLQTASTFVWVRDGVVTQNNKKANQTSLSLYDTQRGIVIANNTLSWTYSLNSLGTTTTTGGTAVSTVTPLTWQSAYHSLKANELSVTTQWVVTLYSPDGRISAPVTLTAYAFDLESYITNQGTITIQPSWWDGLGFCRLRISPKLEKALATSVQVYSTAHLTITDITATYGDEAQAVVASIRSV